MNQILLPLTQAYYDARRNKRNTVNQLNFEFRLEDNLYRLAEEIASRRYQLHPSIAFIVKEPTIREVFAATFRDRVVHHLIFNQINQFWDNHFIYDSYSCRLGKGTHFGIKRMAQFLRAVSDNYTRPAWVLKLDISGYFMHVPRQKVYERCCWGLEKQFREGKYPSQLDQQTLDYLLRVIIFTDPTEHVRCKSPPVDWELLPPDKSLFQMTTDCGFPIGNLTSQLFSNIYLDQLDQLVKHQLKIKYYGRYVDDFVLMDQDKDRLLAARDVIADYLTNQLSLTLHPHKQYLQPYQYGVRFVGGIIKPYCILPGKRLVRNYKTCCYYRQRELELPDDPFARRSLIRRREREYQSYLGQLTQFRSYRLRVGT